MGSLFVCATPIGNLEDITLRAIRILKEVSLIAAEDTRHTRIILKKYDISTPLTSYHKFNIKQKTRSIIDSLKEGRDVALVSDAGMPGICDPGVELIAEAVKSGIKVVPIPGPSAMITAVAVSSIPAERFVFEGFLPAKSSDREKRLKVLKSEERAIVLYEAPHRIVELLDGIVSVIGDRQVAISRELTKKFEEVIRAKASEAKRHFEKNEPKGEMVVVIQGASPEKRLPGDDSVMGLITRLLALKVSKKDTAKLVSETFKLPRNVVYDMVLEA